MGKLGRKFTKLEFKNLGLVIDIYVNSKTGEFAAEYQDVTYSNKDVNLLKQGLQAAVVQGTTLDWKPVIEVEVINKGSAHYESITAGVTVELHRFYIALNGAKTSWLRCGWAVKPEDRLNGAQGYSMRRWNGSQEVPFFYNRDSGYGVRKEVMASEGTVEYTEELWTKLQELQRGLGILAATLLEVMNKEQFDEFFLGRVAKAVEMLPQPAPKEVVENAE